MGSVGENVIKLRKRAKMSQKALAAKLQMTQPSVWRIEKGTSDVGAVELATLLKLAKALGCGVEELVAGVDDDYDLWRRDLSRHADPRSSSAAHSQRSGKGEHDTDGAAATRVQQHHIKERTTFIRDLQDVADELFKLVTEEEERVAREGGAAAAHKARRRGHHRKAG